MSNPHILTQTTLRSPLEFWSGLFQLFHLPTQLPGNPLPWITTEQNHRNKQNQKKKKNGHEMSTYGGFWARLEFFYLLGKTKLEKKKVKVMMGMR